MNHKQRLVDRVEGVETGSLRGMYALTFRLALWCLAVVLLVGTAEAGLQAHQATEEARTAQDALPHEIRVRLAWLDRIERGLIVNGGDSALAKRVARAVVRYSEQRDLDATLVAGVIAVENAPLKPHARNRRSGATGIMQVMPFHVAETDPCGVDLANPETNICYGTRILRDAIRSTTSLRAALLRYNGCVKTPGCGVYADSVFKYTRRIPL